MENKLLMGIIGFVGVLLGFGGNGLLSVDTIDNSYVCTSNQNLGVFTGNNNHPAALSGTSGTGYWIDEDGDNRRSSCRSGKWVTLVEYANQQSVNPEAFAETVNIEPEVLVETKVEIVTAGATVVVAYTDNGKFLCTAPGPGQTCVRDDEIELPLYN